MIGEDVSELLHRSTTRVEFGQGALRKLGACVAEMGGRRVGVVTDPGLERAGHVDVAVEVLGQTGLFVSVFDGVEENPTTEHVAAGVEWARSESIDFLVGVGGGSSLDCMKGINLLLSNGGEIADYWGEDKTTAPMLRMVVVPTTAGTGSEAQSFALISDPVTRRKMACGDRREPLQGGLRPCVAILDPDVTATQPAEVARASGMDAISHAVETAGTTRRTDSSLACSRAAWALLDGAYVASLARPEDVAVRSAMLVGAHLAGAAIERSMLGAAHACANPLTARYGVTHGVAVGMMLPHVVRFDGAAGQNPYGALCDDTDALANRLSGLLSEAGLPRTLVEVGVGEGELPDLGAMAMEQWTAQFNPRPVTPEDLVSIYRAALR